MWRATCIAISGSDLEFLRFRRAYILVFREMCLRVPLNMVLNTGAQYSIANVLLLSDSRPMHAPMLVIGIIFSRVAIARIEAAHSGSLYFVAWLLYVDRNPAFLIGKHTYPPSPGSSAKTASNRIRLVKSRTTQEFAGAYLFEMAMCY